MISHIKGNEPQKVISGIARQQDGESHCWETNGISDGGESISLKLNWEEKLSQIRMIFAPNLNQEIMITMTKRVQEKEVKHMPLELVRDYAVKVYRGENLVAEKQVRDNEERLSVVDLPAGTTGDRVVLEV